MVTVFWPHWKVLLTFLNMLICFSWSIWEVQATSPEPGFSITEHDAIPEKFGLNCSGMTQLRSVIACSEVKNA
jgi:hypothetical protein